MSNPSVIGVNNLTPLTGIPGTLGAGANWNSGVLPAPIKGGSILAACKLTQAGTITIQRYADAAATIPIGTLASSTLVASTANSVNINDGLPCFYFVVIITNTSGSTGTLSGVSILTADK